MKLELKHLAPYLPYGVKIQIKNGTIIDHFTISNEGNVSYNYKTETHRGGGSGTMENLKLILRPLSDLTKEIEINGDKFIPRNILSQSVAWEEITKASNLTHMYYACMLQLFEWHFDVFGLIPAGLAIDINTL